MLDPQYYCMTQSLCQLLSDWNVQMSEKGIVLLQGILEIDPQKRFTIEEICNHPWLDYTDEPPMTMREIDNELMLLLYIYKKGDNFLF